MKNLRLAFLRMMLLLGSLPAARQGQLTAQIIIRDTITISSALQTTIPLQTEQSLTEQPLFVFGGGLVVSTTQPGVVVSGSISVSGDNLPRLGKILLRVQIGEQSYERKLERNCAGQEVSDVSPIPSTLIAGCGSIGLRVDTWHPSGYYCGVSYSRADSLRILVSGSTATYEIVESFYDWDIRKWMTVRVRIQLAGSAGEGTGVQQVLVEPGVDSVVCGGGTDVRVRVKSGSGEAYELCNNAPLLAIASVQAKGEYVYLVAGSETGTSVQFSLRSGEGTVRVVLDTTRGVIPNGRDIATVTVTAGGASGSATIALLCPYPPPSVTITVPAQDTTIVLTETNKPVITFQETHSPSSGKFEPSISWEPSQTINTAEYFEQIQDSLVLTVKVTARNIADMVAVDSVKITFKKKRVILELTTERTDVRPLKTGAPNVTAVKVRATQDGQPVVGVPVVLRVESVANSGGHDHHDASRPRGTVSSASGVTGADGRFTTTYTASEIAGVEEIIAGSPQAAEEVKARIAVKVEGLVTLPTGPHYELVGAPQNHAGTNDPCRVPPPTSQHSRNHYGTAALITAIQNIARAYASLHPGVRLRINDMSLEFGGLFDKDNNWQIPHREHRIGRNADVGFYGIDFSGRCVQIRIRQLERRIRAYTDIEPLPEGNHYHIYAR